MQMKHPLADMLEPVIANLGYETVRIITIGQSNPTLQIMIDRTDGSDITVDDCAKTSRAVSAVLDESDPISGKYNLEVSSPGLDRPLTKLPHFERFAGNVVKVETDTVVENRKRFKGMLKGVVDGNVVLDVEGTEYAVPFDSISKAKIVLTDELLAAYEAKLADAEENDII